MNKYIKLQLVALTALIGSLVVVPGALAAADTGAKPKPAATAPVTADAGAKASTATTKPDKKPADTAKPKAPDKAEPKADSKPPDSASELTKLARDIVGAFRDGKWGYGVLLALLLAIGGIRLAVDRWDMAKFKLGWMEWFATRWGGWTLALAGSTVGALLVAYKAGIGLSFWVTVEIIGGAVLMGFSAAGVKLFLGDLKKGKDEAA